MNLGDSVRQIEIIKNDALVEYNTAGLAQEIFVSKYLIQLPTIDELIRFITFDLKIDLIWKLGIERR